MVIANDVGWVSPGRPFDVAPPTKGCVPEPPARIKVDKWQFDECPAVEVVVG